MSDPDRPRHCRTGFVKPTDRAAPLMLFAYTTPTGHLAAVVSASHIKDAWRKATGKWFASYDHLEAVGYRVTPCMVEWEEKA